MNSYQTLDEKQAILALWYVTNTSLVAFYKLTKQFGTAKNALLASQDAWQNLGIHVAHLKRHQDSLDVLALVERIYQQWQNGAYGWPSFIKTLITSDALIDILCASSATVMVSGT